MSDDPFDVGMDDWYDETQLDYCPRCGPELEGKHPVKCPEHGAVNIDYWEVNEDELIAEMLEEVGDEEIIDMMFGDDYPDKWDEHLGSDDEPSGGMCAIASTASSGGTDDTRESRPRARGRTCRRS